MLLGLLAVAAAEFSAADSSSLKHIANVSFAAEDPVASGQASMFSPRMDFEQWRPLTGRGDPLRNDPTYDYEPPVLERVHYWADDTRLEREHYPERKSEVLMLGVSSRKPSIGARQPAVPARRPHRPPPPKYEDFHYKLDHYPMTILVPPPPPPPGHKTPLFVLGDEKLPHQTPHPKPEPQYESKEPTTNGPEHLTSLYALQESNLIYQSSTTNQNWIINSNQTKSNYSSVSSDYAGWGPTTPLDESDVNDTLNFILNDHFDLSKRPYAFYKPMLSEAPPPPRPSLRPLLLPAFLPTALPPTEPPPPPITSFTDAPSTWTFSEPTTETAEYYEDTTTDKQTTYFQPTPVPTSAPTRRPTTEKTSIFDMFGSMMGMPLVNGPDRPEDNLYAHASNNIHVFKEQPVEDPAKLETMQTMQPPPATNTESSPVHKKQAHNPFVPSGFSHKKPPAGHDPYLHMRYTTPAASTAEPSERKPTTEVPSVPMYLIIQGHSKVKTYGSKPKPITHSDAISNEIPRLNETTEVKHLHTKEKVKYDKPAAYRTSRTQNLKALVENGLGSIEIQEANVGIKYDVSDGSDVPAEIYRKGIVDSDVDIDNYKKKNLNKEPRKKRQVDLEDLIPFDEDTIEEYVFDFLKSHKNETGVTGLIAQAVTSDAAASVVDDLDDDDEDDDDDDDDDDEDR